jgi:probable HAF family extracellular repeat protein
MSSFGSRARRFRGLSAVGAASALTVLVVGVVVVGAPPVAAAPGADRPTSAVPVFVQADGDYTTFDAGDPRVELYPTGINDGGTVVGEYMRPDGESGFVRSPDGTPTPFDVPGARGTEAVKINDSGQIVGRYSRDTSFVDDSAQVLGFVRHPDGRFVRIAVPDAASTLPTGVNDAGQVVGHYIDADGATHGFLWRDRRFTTFDLPGAASTTPLDINDRGDVVGLSIDGDGVVQAFLRTGDRTISIAAPDATTTVPTGVNDAGQVVGYAADDATLAGTRGFMLADGADGPFTPIEVPGSPRSVPLGVNDLGHVVGLYEQPDLTPVAPPAPAPGGAQGPAPAAGGRWPGGVSAPDLATVRGITVSVEIAGQLEAMLAAAEADGIGLTGSGYRDMARQIALRRAHCGTSDYAIYEMPARNCSPPTARPGTSRHERGLAIDFSCDVELIRRRMNPCYRWLAENAAAYGLFNLPSEAWHWSVDGS